MDDYNLIWANLCNELKHKNRFFPKSNILSLTKELCEKSHIDIQASTFQSLYRARIKNSGYSDHISAEIEDAIATYYYTPQKTTMTEVLEKIEKHSKYNDSDYLEYHEDKPYLNKQWYCNRYKEVKNGYYGYNATDSGAPPASLGHQGRANPKGISYLYLSEDVITSIAEVRPNSSDTISIGKFSLNKDLKMVNLFVDESRMKELKLEKKFVTKMSFIFSHPAEDESDYYATQYIAEYIKRLGYDGIIYSSSIIQDKKNYLIFNPENCKCESSSLSKVKSIKYEVGDNFPFS